jgi:hypothetical protein
VSQYRVLPIPATIADDVRVSMKSPQYGHPAALEVATGNGPCRSCLRTFELGAEERILFTYNPFEGIDRYPEPGPIFVHADACAPHAGHGFPAGLRPLKMTLEAFGDERWMLRRERLDGREPEPVLEQLLAMPGVRYVNIRNSEAGCFIARVERG